MKRIGKIFLWLLLTLLVIAGAIVVWLAVGIGPAVKTAVNKFGPGMIGAPVTLRDADFSVASGRILLRGLHVGNPPGFDTPSMFDAELIDIELGVLSLFTDTIHVRRILIERPAITYEQGASISNFKTVQNTMDGVPPPSTNKTETSTPAETKPESGDKKSEPAAKPAKKEQKYIVDEIVIRDIDLGGSITGAGGKRLALKFGEVRLADIGKRAGGVTIDDAMKEIVADLTARIEEASAGLISSLKDTAKELKKSAAPLIDAIKGLFGNKKDKDKDKKKSE